MLPVVAFHVLAYLCPGGFAGVDVFFVISGYLITGGILRDLQKDQFTISGFYHRRIRRIFPATFVLVACVFAVGCAVYYCVPLRRLGDATVMSTLFSANLYFYGASGDYFTPDAHRNPLLHLWSLSVEEQFYLFIPMLCALVWRFRRGWVAPTLATIGVLSLSASVYAVATARQGSAFYLLHYRAWELAAGCLLAMVPAEMQQAGAATAGGPVFSRRARVLAVFRTRQGLLATAGLLLVLIPYAVLSSTTHFPGLAALPSVLGTALLIRYGQGSWINSALSSRPLVSTGKISYSLYLWHWPVTVFWRYLTYDQLCAWDYAGMIGLSFLLAYVSWRFVEIPVRTSSAWTMRRSFAFAGAGTALLVSIGTACVLNEGWPKLLHPRANGLVAPINLASPSLVEGHILGASRRIQSLFSHNTHPVPPDTWAFDVGMDGVYRLGAEREPDLMLLGDSHSGSLRYGMDACLRERGRGGIAVSASSTHMFNLLDAHCQAALAELHRHPSVSGVVLAQYWSRSDHAEPGLLDSSVMFPRLEEFAIRIRRLGKTLFVIGDVPVFSRSTTSDELARVAITPPRKMEPGWNGRQTDAQFNESQLNIDEHLKTICRRTGAVFVPVYVAFRQGDGYSAYANVNGKRLPLYRDGTHLSPAGSVRAARFIMSYVLPDSSGGVLTSNRRSHSL